MMMLPHLASLALLALPAVLAGPIRETDTALEADLRAALLSARDDPAALEAKLQHARGVEDSYRPVSINFGAFTVAHKIGSSPSQYWSSVGPVMTQLPLDGTEYTTEMLQYYIFKQIAGDWPPVKADVGAGGTLVPMTPEQILDGRSSEIEKQVKCAIVMQKGKEGTPLQQVRSLREAPWFDYDKGPENHIENIVCITEW